MHTNSRTGSKLRDAAFRVAVRTGLTETNWVLLKTVRRASLYSSLGSIPAGRLEWRAPTTVTERDVALCERLIAAFALARSQHERTSGTSGIWDHLVDTHHRELVLVAERGDPRALAELLATMFRRSCVFGIAYGAWAAHIESPLGSRIFTLKCLDALIALGEAIGLLPLENPEQDYVGHLDVRAPGALAQLVAAIERVSGLTLSFPEVGASFGIAIDGHLIPFEMPEHIYTAMRLRDALRLHLPAGPARDEPRIVEIGAGYGGVCYWLLRHGQRVARYTIVDLPTVNVLQGYFLAQALGPASVSFLGEPPAGIVVLPASALDAVEAPCDIVLNKDSMPEMPVATVEDYLRWARRSCRGFLYSCNHEAEAPFEDYPQGRVSTAVDRVGGMRRVRRERSWLRRGYVEEVYVVE